MLKQEHQTRVNQRVRLRGDGQDALYSNAAAGSEGWVRKQQHDECGYPMVYIEWDRNHWAENGEQDRWALEAHFEPVEEDKMDENIPERFADEFAKFQAFQQWLQSRGTEPTEEVEEPAEAQQREFNDALADAIDQASEADGFVVMSIGKVVSNEGQTLMVPILHSYFKTPESRAILGSQIAAMAAIMHEELMAEHLRSRGEK